MPSEDNLADIPLHQGFATTNFDGFDKSFVIESIQKKKKIVIALFD